MPQTNSDHVKFLIGTSNLNICLTFLVLLYCAHYYKLPLPKKAITPFHNVIFQPLWQMWCMTCEPKWWALVPNKNSATPPPGMFASLAANSASTEYCSEESNGPHVFPNNNCTKPTMNSKAKKNIHGKFWWTWHKLRCEEKVLVSTLIPTYNKFVGCNLGKICQGSEQEALPISATKFGWKSR